MTGSVLSLRPGGEGVEKTPLGEEGFTVIISCRTLTLTEGAWKAPCPIESCQGFLTVTCLTLMYLGAGDSLWLLPLVMHYHVHPVQPLHNVLVCHSVDYTSKQRLWSQYCLPASLERSRTLVAELIGPVGYDV